MPLWPKQQDRRPRPAEQHGRTVVVPICTLERLAPHAARRKISANELCRRLLDAAADETLVDAILDDTHTFKEDAPCPTQS